MRYVLNTYIVFCGYSFSMVSRVCNFCFFLTAFPCTFPSCLPPSSRSILPAPSLSPPSYPYRYPSFPFPYPPPPLTTLSLFSPFSLSFLPLSLSRSLTHTLSVSPSSLPSLSDALSHTLSLILPSLTIDLPTLRLGSWRQHSKGLLVLAHAPVC